LPYAAAQLAGSVLGALAVGAVWGNAAARPPVSCAVCQPAAGWRDRLKTIIPTYGIDLIQDAAACRDIRAQTAAVLKLANV